MVSRKCGSLVLFFATPCTDVVATVLLEEQQHKNRSQFFKCIIVKCKLHTSKHPTPDGRLSPSLRLPIPAFLVLKSRLYVFTLRLIALFHQQDLLRACGNAVSKMLIMQNLDFSRVKGPKGFNLNSGSASEGCQMSSIASTS